MVELDQITTKFVPKPIFKHQQQYQSENDIFQQMKDMHMIP